MHCSHPILKKAICKYKSERFSDKKNYYTTIMSLACEMKALPYGEDLSDNKVVEKILAC